jgi:hypothetical protein
MKIEPMWRYDESVLACCLIVAVNYLDSAIDSDNESIGATCFEQG